MLARTVYEGEEVVMSGDWLVVLGAVGEVQHADTTFESEGGRTFISADRGDRWERVAEIIEWDED